MLAPVLPFVLVHNALTIAWAAPLVYGLACVGTPAAGLLSRGTLVALGEASYGAYILQFPVNWCVSLVDKHTLRLGQSHPLAAFAVYLAAVIAASLLAFRLIEEPARRWLRHRLAAPAADGRGPAGLKPGLATEARGAPRIQEEAHR